MSSVSKRQPQSGSCVLSHFVKRPSKRSALVFLNYAKNTQYERIYNFNDFGM